MAGVLRRKGSQWHSQSQTLQLGASLDLEQRKLLPNGNSEITLPPRFPDNDLPKLRIYLNRWHKEDCQGVRADDYFCTKQEIETQEAAREGLKRHESGCNKDVCTVKFRDRSTLLSLRFDASLGNNQPQAEAMALAFLRDIGVIGLK